MGLHGTISQGKITSFSVITLDSSVTTCPTPPEPEVEEEESAPEESAPEDNTGDDTSTGEPEPTPP